MSLAKNSIGNLCHLFGQHSTKPPTATPRLSKLQAKDPLILYGDQNAKTSKMPITAYADGYWSRVDIEEEA